MHNTLYQPISIFFPFQYYLLMHDKKGWKSLVQKVQNLIGCSLTCKGAGTCNKWHTGVEGGGGIKLVYILAPFISTVAREGW